MKKLISIALVICLAFAAIGCTAATTPEATAPAAAEQAPAAAEQAAATEPAAGTEEKPVAEEKRVLKFLCIYD